MSTNVSQKQKRILIVGSGAIGALYGSRLQVANAHVTAVCRSNFNEVKKNGFQVTSHKWGEYNFAPEVVENVEKADGVYDYVVVGMKALPENDLPTLLSPVLKRSNETSVVLIQNGIGIESGFPKETPIISVVAYVAVSQIGHGQIKHVSLDNLIIGGYHHPEQKGNTQFLELLNKKTNEFSKLLTLGGVENSVAEEIQLVRWHKIMWNATFNPISILTGKRDTKILLEDPEVTKTIVETMKEIQEITKAALGTNKNFEELGLWSIDEYMKVSKNMPAYKPSMLLDFESERPLETEAIIGNAVRIARKFNVNCPRLETIYSLISQAKNYRRLKVRVK